MRVADCLRLSEAAYDQGSGWTDLEVTPNDEEVDAIPGIDLA